MFYFLTSQFVMATCFVCIYLQIENKRKVAELKEKVEDKMLEYEWKLQAIDELVNLARGWIS